MDERPLDAFEDELDDSPVDRTVLEAQAAEGDELAQWALQTSAHMPAARDEEDTGES